MTAFRVVVRTASARHSYTAIAAHSCDVIAAEDTRVTAKLLAIHGISRPLIPYNDHNGGEMRPRILGQLERGGAVVLVSDAGTPLGARVLAIHGDEEDALVHLHEGLAQALVASQETYSAFASGLRGVVVSLATAVDPAQRFAPHAGGHDVLGEAILLMDRHWPTPEGASRLDRHGLSPAFTIERLMKRSLGHDRQFKRQLLKRPGVCGGWGGGFDEPPQVVVCGHTHIPEATLLARPQVFASSGQAQPHRPRGCDCHVTYINDGSWARAQSRLGRTALVIADDGSIGMVQLERGGRIVAYQPPRFAFNTYPMQRCARCGVLVTVA